MRRVGLSFLSLILATSCAKAAPDKIWTQFSGDKALAHVQPLVDLGQRTPQSEAIEKARAYIKQELNSSGWRETEQPVTDETPPGKVRCLTRIARSSRIGTT